jgi:hypothetical protein
MSEAALKQTAVAELPAQDVVVPSSQAQPAQVNDNENSAHLLTGEQRLFEIPARLWYAMVLCYGLFLAFMLAALGGGYSTLVLVVAAGFVAMFFGTAKAMLNQGPVQPRSPLDRGNFRLPTLGGDMKEREVAIQMLIVPVCAALFGLVILVIRLCVA